MEARIDNTNSKNQVIVRIWLDGTKLGHVSLQTREFEGMEFNDSNVERKELIKKRCINETGAYISLYPIQSYSVFGMFVSGSRNYTTRSLKQDENINKGKYIEHRLITLDVKKIEAEILKLIENNFNFNMLSSIRFDNFSDAETHNCTTLVMHLLEVGGFAKLVDIVPGRIRSGLKHWDRTANITSPLVSSYFSYSVMSSYLLLRTSIVWFANVCGLLKASAILQNTAKTSEEILKKVMSLPLAHVLTIQGLAKKAGMSVAELEGHFKTVSLGGFSKNLGGVLGAEKSALQSNIARLWLALGSVENYTGRKGLYSVILLGLMTITYSSVKLLGAAKSSTIISPADIEYLTGEAEQAERKLDPARATPRRFI